MVRPGVTDNIIYNLGKREPAGTSPVPAVRFVRAPAEKCLFSPRQTTQRPTLDCAFLERNQEFSPVREQCGTGNHLRAL